MVDAATLNHQTANRDDLPPTGANKWEVLREIAAARVTFGLSDRDISVLQALVSFHQTAILGGNNRELIVHPSNKSICERLNGMPCSTMRRHLSKLVQTGFVVRRDSPNGKRYARRYGDEKVTFGFDLSPLVRRFHEVCAAAEAIRAAEENYKRLRATVSLMRRDLVGLITYGLSIRPHRDHWEHFTNLASQASRDLRRKLEMPDLVKLETALSAALDKVRDAIESSETNNMSTNAAVFEQHHHNTNKESYESEPCLENAQAEKSMFCDAKSGPETTSLDNNDQIQAEPEDQNLPNIPLGLVLASCSEFKIYADGPVRHWHDLVRVADLVRPMMGISPSAWEEAKRCMGPEEAAVVVVAMLERFKDIRSPGGYMRSLSTRAADGNFSCGPMIMALIRREAA